ncbi:methionyl-tRNA formyltransferase, partial [Streptomyces sp. SB3404]|nr:methionyl-tRNA formyltransferase [Streptomyces boncukensis]
EGRPGRAQPAEGASYAGWMEEEFRRVDWSRTAWEIHNQVRVFRLGVPGADGPEAEIDGRRVTVLRTALDPPRGGAGVRVECADGPLWVLDHEPAGAPATA